MRICVLHPSYEGSAAPFADFDPPADPARHLPQHTWVDAWIKKATATAQIRDLAREGFDVFVNLCDGAWEEDRAGIEVVHALEKLGQAFTGANSTFYDPTRLAMKMAAHSAGVASAASVIVEREDDIPAAAALRFPLLVKHPHGYSSVGLTPDSRVTSVAALEHEARATMERYGAALVEEFLGGREFTVLVTEPREGETWPWVLEPVEVLFPPGETFKHFDLKWRDWRGLESRPVPEPELAEALRVASGRVFAALGGVGYGRCDLRLDEDGRIHLLEINPNCGIFCPDDERGSADEILARDPAGHAGFLEHLLGCALRRQRRARKPFRIVQDRALGFSLAAIEDLPEGAVIEALEGEPVHLATRGAARRWTGIRAEWLPRYAWPVNEEVLATWSDDPERWRPYDHSCDPNAWLDGLDVVARRPIRRGERISLDYATFCGPGMEPFDCACGTAHCRGRIRGEDCTLPAIHDRYGDHVSPFVRHARRG